MLSFKSVHYERFFVLECMAKIGLDNKKGVSNALFYAIQQAYLNISAWRFFLT